MRPATIRTAARARSGLAAPAKTEYFLEIEYFSGLDGTQYE
jgi:hypothetical protein